MHYTFVEKNIGNCFAEALAKFRSTRDSIWDLVERTPGVAPQNEVYYRGLFFCCGKFANVRKEATNPYHFWVEHGDCLHTTLHNKALEPVPTRLAGPAKAEYLSSLFVPASIVRLNVNTFADAIDVSPGMVDPQTFYDISQRMMVDSENK